MKILALLLLISSESSDAVEPPCPLAGGHGRHVQYRRVCAPGDKHCRPAPHVTYTFVPFGLGDTYTMPQRDQHGGMTRSGSRAVKHGTFRRTTPHILSFFNDCDYVAYYCMRTYKTGYVCGRTYFFSYYTFPTYCLLDYINCMERFDVWHIAYMGECKRIIEEYVHYKHYPYENDYFMDQYYLIEYGHPGRR